MTLLIQRLLGASKLYYLLLVIILKLSDPEKIWDYTNVSKGVLITGPVDYLYVCECIHYL